MENKQRLHDSAIKDEKTMAEIASTYKVHPTQTSRWRKTALEGAKGSFADPIQDELYKDIG